MRVALRQLELGAPRRGGRRPGAGRPRGRVSTKVPHIARPSLSRHHPVHAILRVRNDVTNLRSGPAFAVLRSCFAAVKARRGFAVVHFSVQSNHIHLIVEAADKLALARGMQTLAILSPKRLNRALFRDGTVLEDHYFAEQMKSPAQVRHTLRYVFRNIEHHRGATISGVDSRATEMYLSARLLPEDATVSAPRTWLLTIGWRRVGGRPWPPPTAADVPLARDSL